MNFQSLYEQRQKFFLTPGSMARGGLIFCILVGVVTLLAGFASGQATRTWGSYIFNFMFFFAISLGGIAFAGMQDVIGAKWGRPINRLHESFASFLPVGALALVVLFVCISLKIGRAHEVYKWIADPHMLDHFWGKRDWLKPGFMMGRDLFAVAVILSLAYFQLKNKLSRDLAMVHGNRNEAARLGAEVKAKLRFWSAPVLVCYALCFSLLAFDLTMSLSPTWFSTLWGAWSFAVMMQTLMASTLIFMFVMRSSPVGQVMKRQHFHDVGKLMHGFTIFFAYLTYSHIITYWYGNVPEETSFFITRLQNPWKSLLIVVFFAVFIFPLFGLLPKAAKWTAGWTLVICSSILSAQWLVALLVVIPEVTTPETWSLPWIEAGTFLGFLGLFLTSIFWFGKRFPMVSIGDPLLEEALSGDHH